VFIAHAPSGYIVAQKLIAFYRERDLPLPSRAIIAIAMLGALAPDFDLLYGYLWDHGQTHHHRYWTHWPIVWFALSGFWVAGFYMCRARWAWGMALFCACGCLHIVLDTLVGDIWWLAPFQDRPYALFTVPARFSPWWLNFFLHWSFAAELAICAWAATLWLAKRRNESS
jgi:inner membrane protein